MSDELPPGVFRVGMDVVQAPVFTPPEVRPGPAEWEPYRSPRFTRGTRVLVTIGILAVPAFLLLAALVQLVGGEGRARAAAAILLFPLVPAGPLLVRAWRDLWGTEKR